MKYPVTATIYIVDDDDAVRDSMRALLESHGLTVRDYASAHRFLDDEEPHERNGAPRCLLLDLHMPGMGGAELLDRLKEKSSPIPVIVLTGRADVPLRDRVIRAGARILLEKPVDHDDLMREITLSLADKAAD